MSGRQPLCTALVVLAVVATLAAVAAVAPVAASTAHTYAHTISLPSGNKTQGPCFLMVYDGMFLSYPDAVHNVSSSNPQNVGGTCFQYTPIKDQEGNCSLSAAVTFGLQDGTLTVAVNLEFNQNATYTCPTNTSTPKALSGDQSSALAGIKVVASDTGAKPETLVFAGVLDYDFAMDKNISYQCNYNFTFSTNNTTPPLPSNAANATFTIRNIHVQPFMEDVATGFAPTNDNSYCPRDDTAIKIIGLIVGGSLAGVALLGIILFTISTCRNKAYERI